MATVILPWAQNLILARPEDWRRPDGTPALATERAVVDGSSASTIAPPSNAYVAYFRMDEARQVRAGFAANWGASATVSIGAVPAVGIAPHTDAIPLPPAQRADGVYATEEPVQVAAGHYLYIGISDISALALLWIGEGVEMPRGPSAGFVPPELATESIAFHRTNRIGQGMGAIYRDRPGKTAMAFPKISSEWATINWPSIQKSLSRGEPAFLMWDTRNHSGDTALITADGEVPNVPYNTARYVDINLNILYLLRPRRPDTPAVPTPIDPDDPTIDGNLWAWPNGDVIQWPNGDFVELP